METQTTGVSSNVSGGTYSLCHAANWAYSGLLVRDCQFWNGGNELTGAEGSVAALHNNLFVRSGLGAFADASSTLTLSNNLVRNAEVVLLNQDNANLWRIHNNAFDHCAVSSLFTPLTNSHNAYINCDGRLSPTNINDMVLQTFSYASGPLGDFYHASTNLLNAGSVTNAALAGLYHYTTTTNQVKETNSIVDIGFHYVAVDTNGNPASTYWTTIPDYLADPDGSGDLSAWLLQHFGQLGVDPDDDPDGDWITNLQEYQAGSNPRDVMVVAWGNNANGQCNVPESLRNVAAVAGGLEFSLARTNGSDGSVRAWGANTYGQTNLPAGLTNVARITAAFRQAAVAKSNGTVVAWGLTSGSVPADLTNAVSVAAGLTHMLALRNNGQVTAWGENDYGQCNVPVSVTNAAALTAGSEHSLALLANGTVIGWGLNAAAWGWNLTNPPAGLSNVVAIAAGDFHNLALKSDGTVVAWGAGNGTNLSGNFLNSEQGQSIVPAGLSNVIAIAAGGYRSLALRSDGTMIGWGDNLFGQGTAPPGVTNLTAIAAAPNHTLAIRDARQLPIIMQHPSDQAAPAGSNVAFTAKGLGLAEVHYQWQFNGTNMAGETNATLTLNNVQASHEGSYQVIISTGAGSFTSSAATFTLITPPVILSQTQPDRQWAPLSPLLVLWVNATAPAQWASPLSYQWKLNGTNLPSASQSNYYVLPFTSSEQRHYSVTITNAAGVTNSMTWKVKALPPGGIAAWGRNNDNQLAWPATATNVIAVAAGGSHSLAAREGGSVVAWGLNDAGQTNGPALTNAIAVAAGNKHSLALRDNGTVVAWGRNVEGQTTVPAGLTNAIAIGACGNQSIALRKNGTVTNWGNTNGTIPSNLTNAIAIAAGTNFCVALRSNGTVTAWGNNDHDQISVPGNATNVVAIAAGAFHALALKENGTIVAWGLNTLGQCDVPVGLSNVMAVAAGWAHSAALKNDGTIVAWGDNTYEQTDVGGGLAGIKLLAAGGDHTLASAFSSNVLYQVEVSKDLLLVYNSSSTDSSNVWHYYMQHRPMVSGANVLGIDSIINETYLPEQFTNQLAEPVGGWLAANPTKRPQYVVLFLDIPSRVNLTNEPAGYYWAAGTRASASVQLHNFFPNWRPFITHINMGGTNACKAYIDKLATIGGANSPGKVVLSASAGGYGNTNYLVDGIRHGGPSPQWENYASSGDAVFSATNGLVAAGTPTNAILLADGLEVCIETNSSGQCIDIQELPHPNTLTNVAGYICWGFHSSLDIRYAQPGYPQSVQWTGNSGWWLIQTIESPNGQRVIYGEPGLFLKWFAPSAFGGTNYSNTPVGGVTHTDEPNLTGVNDAALYFGLWARGKNFGMCAWNSRNTPVYQAVGDPFVTR